MAYRKPIPRYTWDNLPLTLTVGMVAELMHCSTPTVRTLCRSGKIKAGRVNERAWVISRDVLKNYIEGGETNEGVANDSGGEFTCVCTGNSDRTALV